MPKLLDVHFRPPFAIARLGGSSIPLENYQWTDDPAIHGASHTVIEPATTLDVLSDGSVLPYMPSLIKFSDEEGLRPVAPFFELWATVEYTAEDEAAEGSRVEPGSQAVVPLTSTLLSKVGGSLAGVLYTVHVANRKAARRTGDVANSFEGNVQVKGDDHQRRELLASTLPKPNQEPLVFSERPISLGHFHALRPMPRAHLDVNLDVLRVRFTPARGKVYGPPSAVVAQSMNNARIFEIVAPENRILNPQSSWLRYNGDYATYMNPEPFDTYDGADQDGNISWGVVDDTCDGLIRASVVVGARRYTATARVCAGPPDYAPDRRPFVSLADDLTDRDEEPLSNETLRSSIAETRATAADLFERAFETSALMNLDMVRTRAIRDNASFIFPSGSAPTARAPHTDDRSFTVADRPYADDRVTALIQNNGNPTPGNPLPFTTLVPLAHSQLAQADELLSFIRSKPERARQMLRPAFGSVAELDPAADLDSSPSPDHRDPRIERDLAHDMRMPPYMRDETASALSLTRKQYVELIRSIEILSQGPPGPFDSGRVPRSTPFSVQLGSASSPLEEDSALRKRVREVVSRLRAAESSRPRR